MSCGFMSIYLYIYKGNPSSHFTALLSYLGGSHLKYPTKMIMSP